MSYDKRSWNRKCIKKSSKLKCMFCWICSLDVLRLCGSSIHELVYQLWASHYIIFGEWRNFLVTSGVLVMDIWYRLVVTWKAKQNHRLTSNLQFQYKFQFHTISNSVSATFLSNSFRLHLALCLSIQLNIHNGLSLFRTCHVFGVCWLNSNILCIHIIYLI